MEVLEVGNIGGFTVIRYDCGFNDFPERALLVCQRYGSRTSSSERKYLMYCTGRPMIPRFKNHKKFPLLGELSVRRIQLPYFFLTI